MIDEQRYGSGLSQDKIVKIGELRRLLYKYPQYFTNPDGIIKWAVYCSSNGDDRFRFTARPLPPVRSCIPLSISCDVLYPVKHLLYPILYLIVVMRYMYRKSGASLF